MDRDGVGCGRVGLTVARGCRGCVCDADDFAVRAWLVLGGLGAEGGGVRVEGEDGFEEGGAARLAGGPGLEEVGVGFFGQEGVARDADCEVARLGGGGRGGEEEDGAEEELVPDVKVVEGAAEGEDVVGSLLSWGLHGTWEGGERAGEERRGWDGGCERRAGRETGDVGEGCSALHRLIGGCESLLQRKTRLGLGGKDRLWQRGREEGGKGNERAG